MLLTFFIVLSLAYYAYIKMARPREDRKGCVSLLLWIREDVMEALRKLINLQEFQPTQSCVIVKIIEIYLREKGFLSNRKE